MASVSADRKSLTPEEARRLFRVDELNVPSTSGICIDHEQGNLVMVDAKYADEFAEFCCQNPAPCPVLYRSAPGEFRAPPLANNSDVRTDVQRYCVFTHGERSATTSLSRYDWDNVVTFYVGCSFGLEHLLLSRGVPVRHMEQTVTVPMFKTSVMTRPIGVFRGPLVVSMRPMPEEHLASAVNASRLLPMSHGMPVHIGHPSWIGIGSGAGSDLRPCFGDAVRCEVGDVHVFWACGVTTSVALSNAGLDLCFSHYPGSMFICDSISRPDATIDASRTLEVVKYSTPRLPVVYSVLSTEVRRQVEQLEKIILRDPGQRGVGHLAVDGSLLMAALSLSSRHKRVAVATGFPCVPEPPYEETDGIMGAIALVRALHALGAEEVVLLCDAHALPLYRSVVDFCLAEGTLARPIAVRTVSDAAGDAEIESDVAAFDHLVAIERVSPNEHGQYRSMAGRDLSAHCSPVDRWFTAALKNRSVMTTGIGDGGNEVGMANVGERVAEFVPLGKEIASAVHVDHLVSAGVSNWGGYALAAAIYALQACPEHSCYSRYGLGEHRPPDADRFLPTAKREERLLEKLNEMQVWDGARPDQKMSVDGYLFHDIHTKMISTIRAAVGH